MTRFFFLCEILFVGALSAFLIYAGIDAFWGDSEMWNTVVVKHLFSDLRFYDFAIKPLFDLLLYANFQIAEMLHVHPMVTARVLFAGNAVFSLVVFYRIALRLAQRREVAGILTCLLFTNSFFIKRFSSVRSDLAVTGALLGLFALSNTEWWSRQRGGRRVLVAFAFFVLCYLLTPKSVLLTAAWAAVFLRQELKSLRRRLLVPGLVAAALALYYGHHALRFFLSSFGVGTGLSYWDWHRAEHVVRLLTENPLLLCLWLFNLYCGLWRSPALDRVQRAYFNFANFCLLLLLVYPDRLPFFIAGLLPFWILPFASIWPNLATSQYVQRHRWRRLVHLVLAFCVLSGLFWSSFLVFAHNSAGQRRFVTWLEEQRPALDGLSIYDPVGVLPFAEGANYWFVGPAEPGNAFVLENIKQTKIDVLFYTARAAWLGQPLMDYLKENYWHDGAGIFVRKAQRGVTGQTLAVKDLLGLIKTDFPALAARPNHVVHLQLLTDSNVDLSRFAKWHSAGGKPSVFSSDVSIAQIEQAQTLELPPGVERIVLLPIHLQTPFTQDWLSLFRFDSEI